MVPFEAYVSLGPSKPRLIFSRVNGPIVTLGQKEKKKAMTTGLNFIIFTLNYFWQADWLIFMVNKRTDTSDFYLCKTRSFAERMPNFDACFFFS